MDKIKRMKINKVQVSDVSNNDLHSSKTSPGQKHNIVSHEVLQKQIEVLNEIIDTKNMIIGNLISDIIALRQNFGEDLLDILFELYARGIVSISELKKLSGINQYDFIYQPAERGMDLVYPDEDEIDREFRLSKASFLL